MSSKINTANAGVQTAAQHVRDNAHDAHLEEHAHGSFKSYMIGFVLSVILTAIPFWLVMDGMFDNRTTGIIIVVFAAVQVVVHMIFFLHMNTKSEEGWTVLALMFTAIVVVIVLAGSLWVMYHLNTNMMPGMDMPGAETNGQGPVTSDPAPSGNGTP